MAYDPAVPARVIGGDGLSANSSGASQIYLYESSHPSSVVAASTAAGFFAGCGAPSRSTANIGMKLRDLVCVRETSAGASPGKVTWHSVISSTVNVVTTAASSGFGAGLDCSLSTFGISTN